MKTPVHLWIVGVLAVLWNAGGGFDYIMSQTQNADYLAAMPAEGIAFLANAPIWFDFAWAIAIWFSILGALLLLLRSRFASPVFGISILGMIVSSVYTYILSEDGSNALAVGGTAALIFTIIIPIIAVGLWLYARAMTRKGVLR